MADYLSFLKNFQTILTSFQDIGTIYDKLEVQGHLKKLVSLFIEIFNEEHEFTLGELKRYGQEQNVKEEDFLEEQYELNSTIFRKNFSLIVQSLAEEIGKGFLNKFRAENNIEGGGRKYSGTIKIEPDVLEEQRHSGVQKPQYKSDMPEIQEEIESTGRVSPPKSSARSRQSDPEVFPKSARNFELNIDELHQQKSNRDGQSAQPTASSDRLGRVDQSIRAASPNSGIRQKDMPVPTQALAKALNAEHMAYAAGEIKRMKDSLQSSSSSRDISHDHLSNPLPRSPSYERQSHSSNNQSRISSHSHQGFSASNKFFKSTGSLSSSKFSVMGNPGIDPSVLDSEFSHTKGMSFGRSERMGLFLQGNAPGPGSYEPDEGLNVVKKKAPTASFSRSPKFSIFDKAISESPGAIYYPSHHFVSK